ncbi:MAG: hydroxymethylbilane synthase [Caulobacterales bacterium]|nr:hydroxymethylbilane synthase [Caulobacterales bacterium]
MALAQTAEAVRLLQAARPGLKVEIAEHDTDGDRDQRSKLAVHGGKGGAFVAGLRRSLREGAIELAMHSLKDIPGNEETPGVVIGAHLRRDEVEDALVLRPDRAASEFFARKAAGYRVGTNSVRRAAQVKRLFPDVEIIHYRGAADTRVRKLDEQIPQTLPDGGATEPADALIMARSGLQRVGLAERIAYIFDHNEMLPPAGQGIVVLECAEEDWPTRQTLAEINDREAERAGAAERELLWLLNGHCNSPIGAHARITDESMVLTAQVLSLDGSAVVEGSVAGPAERPRELGRRLGLRLLEQGAGELIEGARLAER